MTKLTVYRNFLAISALFAAAVSPALRAEDAPPKPERAMPSVKFDGSALPGNTPSYAPIVEKVDPSVVTISTSKLVHGGGAVSGPYGNNPLFNDPNFRKFFGIPDQEEEDPQAPAPKGNKRSKGDKSHKQALGLGSGVIVSADGFILTNNHVIDGADDIVVTIGTASHEYKATKIGADSSTDIAVIKIDAKDLPAITFSDSDKLRPGDIVIAVGNPFALTQSATMGIVSAVGRGNMGIVDYENFIQTDASINMGNSGGALVDYEGRLVGINTAIFSRTGGNQGIGFAVPANLARSVMESLLKNGKVQRGFLGVGLQPLNEDLVKAFGLPNDNGALISEVQPGSPADKAGIKTGDVIVSVEGKKVESPRELQLTVAGLAPGSKAELKIMREGKDSNVAVTLGERPSKNLAISKPEATEDEPDVLDGVTVGDIDADLRKEYNLPASVKGVIITQIDPDSPSAAAGLSKGDVVVEINKSPVSSAKEAVELSEKVKKEKKVLLRVQSKGATRYVVVERK